MLGPSARQQYEQLTPDLQKKQYDAILRMIEFRGRQDDFLGGILLVHYHNRLPITIGKIIEPDIGIGCTQWKFAILLPGERLFYVYVIG